MNLKERSRTIKEEKWLKKQIWQCAYRQLEKSKYQDLRKRALKIIHEYKRNKKKLANETVFPRRD